MLKTIQSLLTTYLNLLISNTLNIFQKALIVVNNSKKGKTSVHVFKTKRLMIFQTEHFLLNCLSNSISMTKETNTFKPINVREVFAEKSPRMAKLVPGFVYRYIHRILHLDWINSFLEKNGHEMGVKFVYAAVKDFNITEHVHNAENIPNSGNYIFASNHPLGGFDSMLLMRNVDEKLGALKSNVP